MNLSTRWLAANAIGTLVAMPLFGFVADGIVDPAGPLDIPMHFVGALTFAAVLAAAQRRAVRARHTSYVTWVLVQAVALFLGFGLAFTLIGPPVDFVAGVVAFGAATGFLLGREAVKAGARPRLLALKGAGAGLASVVGMIPVFLVAQPITDSLGGGQVPFMIILTLIGGVTGVAIGALLRPPMASAPVEATREPVPQAA
jgi:hypothetical protein